MKFYQRRSVALIVLVLAILGASVYGLSKKPAPLPKVEYMHWIADEANLLSKETEQLIESYNDKWDSAYRALIAVVAVDDIQGWKAEDYTYTLGNEWGLGANDMLLLVVKNDHYYVALGDTLLEVMTDTQQSKLQSAIEKDYYDGKFDAAVVSFFRQADVFYAQALSNVGSYPAYVWEDGAAAAGADTGSAIFGVIAVVIVLFAVWALLDRVRYNRYRRRVVVTPSIPYNPVFWGRPTVVRPVVTTAPPRPVQPAYRSNSSSYRSNSSSGSYRPNTSSGTVRSSSGSSSRPSRSGGSSRSGSSRGSSFGKGGFGGGRR